MDLPHTANVNAGVPLCVRPLIRSNSPVAQAAVQAEASCRYKTGLYELRRQVIAHDIEISTNAVQSIGGAPVTCLYGRRSSISWSWFHSYRFVFSSLFVNFGQGDGKRPAILGFIL